MRPQAIELFAGGGGFRLGLEPAFETVLAIEKDPQIAEVYASNFYKPNIKNADVSNICFKKYAGIDLIVGGPPCQDYSYADVGLIAPQTPHQLKNTEIRELTLSFFMTN